MRIIGFVFFGIFIFIPLAVLAIIFSDIKGFFSSFEYFFPSFFIIFAALFVFLSNFRSIGEAINPKDYEIEKLRDFSGDENLKEFEKHFLTALFENGGSFSTDMGMADKKKKETLYKKIKEAEKELFRNVDFDTQAYEVGTSAERKRNDVMLVILVAISMAFLFSLGRIIDGQSLVFLASLIFLIFEFFYFKYEARLNKEGEILKEDWLGFKLYLETAEKYRMQNLTPDLFEKYLPYAIIFGVEKMWAKNFDSLNMTSPQWYVGSAVAGHSAFSGSGVSSFSASSFASSFSASFASSFSSSGAGGAGGGGGGAGGGGGGGGGGAS